MEAATSLALAAAFVSTYSIHTVLAGNVMYDVVAGVTQLLPEVV